MNIAFCSIYPETYSNDQIFNPDSCAIGENLLLPIIALKTELEKNGHSFHTFDVYNPKDIDYVIFQDLDNHYCRSCSSIKDYLKYIIERRWKMDYLNYACKNIPKKNRLLIIQEPPVVCPNAYNKRLHELFGKVLTWNDNLVDNKHYFKYFIPQPKPNQSLNKAYDRRKLLVMMCGNKNSKEKNELYSMRRKEIGFFDNQSVEFDLYGYGWEKENIHSYKGVSYGKLKTLSNYKFCICYENMCNIPGYVTEKIFDCFYSHCIPIYWGASNIDSIIPSDVFIDRRLFNNSESLLDFINGITETKYNAYIRKAEEYLNSSSYITSFSINSYVEKILNILSD